MAKKQRLLFGERNVLALQVSSLRLKNRSLMLCASTRSDEGEGYGAFLEVLWRKVRERHFI